MQKNKQTSPISNGSDDESFTKYDSIERITKRLIPIKTEKTTKEIIKKIENNEVSDTHNKTNNITVCDLNIILFKESSNKNRNERIKMAWKTLENYNIPDNLKIIKSYPGHIVTLGRDSGSLKNPYWLVKDKKYDTEFYIMYFNNNVFTYFSKEDLKEVVNPQENIYPTWSYHEATGYISTRTYPGNGNTMTYLHQIICKKYNKKQSQTQSVDHINRNKLDNRKENLRFASQSIQNSNRDKCKRQYCAKPLPDNLVQSDLPKYVIYYSENYGPNKEKSREWFNIEKHPNQESKRWSTTKSGKISIRDKLDLAKKQIEEFNKLIPT